MWIGEQAIFQKSLILRVEIVSELLGLCFVGLVVSRVLKLAFQVCCRAHCRTPAIERAPASKSKPCLIPQKDKVRLNSQALFHDSFDVVYLTVEGTVSKDQHPCPLEFSLGL